MLGIVSGRLKSQPDLLDDVFDRIAAGLADSPMKKAHYYT